MKDVTLQVIGTSQVYRDFSVDSMGWPLVENIPAISDGWDIPRYPFLQAAQHVVVVGEI